MSIVRSFLAGAVTWTGLEYLLHRFAMHEAGGRGLASREHLRHHADLDYFSPTPKKLLSASATTAVLLPAGWALVGRRRALWFTGGAISSYAIYEVLHRRAHTHPPRNRYGRWLRRSHFHHHFGHPMANHGVTTPVWDRVCGTYDEPGTVRVPRRWAMAWLVDADGEVAEAYRGDYEVVGRTPSSDEQRSSDHDAAFANQAPAV
jgi:4-hydroxysphinganine ceramide fatty acyl 2-hydroxylase